MDNYVILAQCLALLYWESHFAEPQRSEELVRGWLEKVKVPESSLNGMRDREELNQLKQICIGLLDAPLGEKIDANDFKSKLRIILRDNPLIFESISDYVNEEVVHVSILKNTRLLQSFLRASDREDKLTKVIRDASTKVCFHRAQIPDLRKFAAELIASLDPFQQMDAKIDTRMVSSLDVDNLDSVETVFREAATMSSNEGMIQFGWQDLNVATQGGARRGEEIVINALQHNYKTGFSLTLFKQMCEYNTPYLIDKTKKPLMVRISFEDELPNNVRFLYENISINEHGVMPVFGKLHERDMAKYVVDRMKVNGYHVKMYRYNPSDFALADLKNLILDLESQGYEIHVCMIDYLRQMNLSGCDTDGATGTNLRDLFRKARNFFSAKKITLITPHQLSVDATMLVREGYRDFVKHLPGKNYYEGSKQLGQEMDLELYIHIEVSDGRSYLTVMRGKHRGVPAIPESKKYFVLPFPETGPIPDDLNKPRISQKKVGVFQEAEEDEYAY
jgi:hypothetical protein